MMKVKYYMLFALWGILSVSCADKAQQPIEKVSWLLGTWEYRVQGQSVYERWTAPANNEMLGTSYAIVDNDTLVFENLWLYQKQDTLCYEAKVQGQNNGNPIRFTLTSSTDTELVFENPQHDFPQRIAYTRVGVDSLVATISGMEADKEHSESFSMKKQ